MNGVKTQIKSPQNAPLYNKRKFNSISFYRHMNTPKFLLKSIGDDQTLNNKFIINAVP